MALIVQKYGGTSVGNPERIKNVAKRVAEYRSRGDSIVVIVSAMSGVTESHQAGEGNHAIAQRA
jgi:aspartate kinase